MARQHRQTWDASSSMDETRVSNDDLIRPGLSRAFPLPDHSHLDQRFARLLEALAQIQGGGEAEGWSAAVFGPGGLAGDRVGAALRRALGDAGA